MEERKLYLHRISIDEALHLMFEKCQRLQPLEGEEINTADAVGRVSAQPVFAKYSSPNFNAAAMDGVAVKAEDTFAASDQNPITLRIGGNATWVNTGHPIPKGFDAVIMAEDIEVIDEERIMIRKAVSPWHHVRSIGEDFVATELLLTENHLIRPVDLAPLLSGGCNRIVVRKKPRVAIIPTGSELREAGSEMAEGEVIETNSIVIGKKVEEWGGVWQPYPILEDDYEIIRTNLTRAAESADLVVINAGSSAGTKDFTAKVIEDIGELIFHGVKIKPGKPVIFGVVAGTPIIGIPGYPVAAAITSDIFVRAVVYAYLGLSLPQRSKTTATLARKVVSPLGEEEYLQVKLGYVGKKMIATPISRGSGVTMSLVRSDGIVRIKSQSQGIEAGEKVEVELVKEINDVEHTIVAIGSHDLCLDILASELRRKYLGVSLSSAHVGSLGGLIAIKKGEAHLAGIHLLDEETGEYNISYCDRFLPGGYLLVNLVGREQGIMVKKGNPKEICGVKDLARSDIIFVNRQKGAGTRQLLDYCLKKEGLSPERINGYEREYLTHMAVASAVASGVADAGIGIRAAAVSLGLEFIFLSKERYDLVIPKEFMRDSLIEKLLLVIRSNDFKARVNRMLGYDTTLTGKVVIERV
jgi:putative molybdopterin biosynthesis protein